MYHNACVTHIQDTYGIQTTATAKCETRTATSNQITRCITATKYEYNKNNHYHDHCFRFLLN